MRTDALVGLAPYALGTSELAALVANLETKYAVALDGARGRPDPLVAIRVAFDDPVADMARTNEQTVFERDLGDNHTAELMAREYGPYETESVFYLAYDAAERRVVGSSRGIYGTGGRPPKVFDLIMQDETCKRSVKDRMGHSLDLGLVRSCHDIEIGDGILDFATLAVSPDARYLARSVGQLRPSILLYSAMVRDSYFLRGDVFGAGEATMQLVRFLRSLAGMPAIPIAGLEAFAAFEGDEVLSAPFIFRWEDWISAYGERRKGTKKLGLQIYDLAVGAFDFDPILF